MADFADVQKESNKLRYDFVLTELDLALTIVNVAFDFALIFGRLGDVADV